MLSDAELLAQADELRAEAGQVLAALDLPGAFAGLGQVQVIGSYVSGLDELDSHPGRRRPRPDAVGSAPESPIVAPVFHGAAGSL